MSRAETKRFISISGAANFRHLGGYPTSDGKVTRSDRLFRSGWFELVTDEDRRRFSELGIRIVCDFRTAAERERKPLLLEGVGSVEHHHLEISNGSMGPYLQRVRHLEPTDIDCKGEMARMYEGMVVEAIPRLKEFFAILRETSAPVLICCSTGKDRTGVASAITLAALGVSKKTIFSDYLLSADVYAGQELTFARNHGLASLGQELDVFKDIFTVHAEYLERAWSSMHRMSGSINAFLTEHLVASAALADLRRKYLRDAPTSSSGPGT